jgi:site-specific DNA-methyltransferase (adenine-specific)
VNNLGQFKSANYTVSWSTPKDVYAALDVEFHFDYDPCPLRDQGTAEHDGLSTLFNDWTGKRVFCNPPYGPGIGEWLTRGLQAEIAVYLIPARTDTKWFHDIVLRKAKEVRFIRGRLKFGGAKQSAPFPSMIIVFRNQVN